MKAYEFIIDDKGNVLENLAPLKDKIIIYVESDPRELEKKFVEHMEMAIATWYGTDAVFLVSIHVKGDGGLEQKQGKGRKNNSRGNN